MIRTSCYLNRLIIWYGFVFQKWIRRNIKDHTRSTGPNLNRHFSVVIPQLQSYFNLSANLPLWTCVHMCVVSCSTQGHTCTCWYAEAGGGRQVSCPITLCLFPLRCGLSVNLDQGWQPTSLGSQGVHAQLFTQVLEYKPRASWLWANCLMY